MAGICTATQANPDPSSIIIGAVQLAISLAIQFVTFFDRLTDMLDCFNDYLEPLAEYAKASNDSELMRQMVAIVYGDLLKFCTAARHVFVDNSGARRQWTSMRTFLQVQWEPFECRFGEIETKFRHHLNVLQHSAEASQINTLLRLEKNQNSELYGHQIGADSLVLTTAAVDEREAFLSWISQVDFEKSHEDIYATKHPGTGDWLLQTEQFQTWLDHSQSKLLWCHGKGK